jgi:PAS domain S-box-containing protein
MKTVTPLETSAFRPDEEARLGKEEEVRLAVSGGPTAKVYQRDAFLIETVGAFFKQAFETDTRTTTNRLIPDRAALSHLQTVIDNSTAVIYMKDAEGRYLLVNRNFENTVGLSRQQIIGKTDYLIFPDADARHYREHDKRVLKTGKPIEVKETVAQADGPHTYVSVKFPLKDAEGTVYAQAGISTDITDPTHFTESRRLLAAIVESSEDAIISKDLNGTITSWNTAAEGIYGYSADEIVGKPVTVLIPSDRQHEEPEILARIRAGERISHFETVRRRKDGSEVNVSLSISPVKGEKGKIVGASKIARDITKRKRLELQQQTLYELAINLNRASALPEIYEAALEAICRCQGTSRAAILLYEPGGTMRFKAWRHLSEEYRESAEKLLEVHPAESWLQPTCVSDVAKAWWDERVRTIVMREQIRAVALLPIIYEKRSLGRFTVYYDTPHNFNDEELRTAQTITSMVAFAIERHERLAELREAVLQMEEFSYSLSHDLRAPIRAMSGYAQVLMEESAHKMDETTKEHLGRIVQGGQRADRLIQDTLTYSHVSRREIRLHPVSLEKLTREIIQQQDASVKSSQAQVAIESPLLPVIGNESSLTQAVSNLLNNAIKFVAPGTTPQVRLRTELRGNNVRLWIQDNGIGVKPEYQHRLFGMFERIEGKRDSEDTGIGLAIVRRAVERMRGAVGVESDGVNGSKFWIELPATKNV